MEKKKLDLLVAGNATEDAHILDIERIETSENMISVTSRGETVEFEVEDAPIRKGHKHRVNQDIQTDVKPLAHKYRAGGGGVNSALAIAKHIPSDSQTQRTLSFQEVGGLSSLVMRELEGVVRYDSFNRRPSPPINAIIPHQGDRYILKGNELRRYSPSKDHLRRIDELIEGKDGLLTNNVKDHEYLRAYIAAAKRASVPLYSVIAPSLTRKFDRTVLFGEVIPVTRPILNYDELPDIYGVKKAMTDEEKVLFAFEKMEEIRSSGVNTEFPLFTTFGRYGAAYASRSAINHIHLDGNYVREVDEISRSQGTNGAGDAFAGALFALDCEHRMRFGKGMPLSDLVKKACSVAIRHIGYKNEIPLDAFRVQQISEYDKTPLSRTISELAVAK